MDRFEGLSAKQRAQLIRAERTGQAAKRQKRFLGKPIYGKRAADDILDAQLDKGEDADGYASTDVPSDTIDDDGDEKEWDIVRPEQESVPPAPRE